MENKRLNVLCKYVCWFGGNNINGYSAVSESPAQPNLQWDLKSKWQIFTDSIPYSPHRNKTKKSSERFPL